jgi:16S rRNA (cytosine967-C5)-methyltransferase
MLNDYPHTTHIKPKMNARYIATQVLIQVILHRHSLSPTLDNYLPQLREARERALAQAICYGVLRWLPRLQALVHGLVTKPLKEKDHDIQIVLLIGLYQHIYLRIPPHAATATTVDLARALKKNWATGFINGVLRHFLRQKTSLLAQVDNQPTARLAHPTWILNQLQQQWANDWETVAHANNAHPPLTLRVNANWGSRNQYLEHLRHANIEAIETPYADYGVTIINQHSMETPDQSAISSQDHSHHNNKNEKARKNKSKEKIDNLPGFNQGWVSVQDGAAQLIASLLNLPIGARVLDACAAPGGKSALLLERHPKIQLLALDNQASRITKLENTLQRLQLKAQVRCADASEPNTWWDGQPFDCILLDVPCSGSGVIRRHPDIKYLRQPDDITSLAQQQIKLINASWKLLAKGGQLLYVTCSVFAQENIEQLQNFLDQHPDAKEQIIQAPWGHALPIGRQILPGEDNFDGFYYARLLKSD